MSWNSPLAPARAPSVAFPNFTFTIQRFYCTLRHVYIPILADAWRVLLNPMSADLNDIQQKIIAFRNERDWAQFHDPKNLAEALSIEAGELLENFPWKTIEQSRNLSADRRKRRGHRI